MKKNEGMQRKNREKHASKKQRISVRPAALKMKIKKGDKVQVVSGKDKGKTGEVIAVYPRMNTVLVEGVAVAKRSLRRTGAGQSGRIVERPMPVNASNVMRLVDGKPTRARRAK